MAHNQFPPAPPAPPPFPNATFPPPPQGPVQPQGNRFGPQNNGLPFEQFAGMQIDPNAQRPRVGPPNTQFAQTLDVPTKYEGVTLRKDPNPPFSAEPSWSRVKETPTAMSNEELIKAATNKKSKDSGQKELKKLKSDKQRAQIEQLVDERRALERHPNAEWILVSVEEDRGPGQRPFETETKALRIILKRQQKGKPMSEGNSNVRKESVQKPKVDIPGIVRDLNMPRRQSAPQQVPQSQFVRPPYQGPPPMSGSPMGQYGGLNPNSNPQGGGLNTQGPPNFPNPQLGLRNPPPPQFKNVFENHQPQPQPNRQGMENVPPPPPPIAIPVPGHPSQQSGPVNRPINDEIVHIVDGRSPPSKQPGKSIYNGLPKDKAKTTADRRQRSSVVFNTSSDDEDSSHLSRTSEEFTNITTPTSGTGSLPRGLERSKSGRQRRHSGIDYMADGRGRQSRERRESRSRRHSRDTDELLDEYVEVSPHRVTGRDRGSRDRESRDRRTPRPFYGERSVSDALYKPQRRMTATELLDQEYMRRLEELRRDEDVRLDQRLRERELYEIERDQRRYRSPPRYDSYYDYSPSRYSRRR